MRPTIRFALAACAVLSSFAGDAGAQQSPASATARRQRASLSVLWTWQYRRAPRWRAIRRKPDREGLDRLAATYNRRNNHRGWFYVVTDGEPPADKPDWSGRRRRTNRLRIDRKSTELLALSATVHDFGTMPTSRQGSHTFRISNSGIRPLRLTLTDVSCGCTSVKAGGEPLSPAPLLTPVGDLSPTPLDADELPKPGEGGIPTLQQASRALGRNVRARRIEPVPEPPRRRKPQRVTGDVFSSKPAGTLPRLSDEPISKTVSNGDAPDAGSSRANQSTVTVAPGNTLEVDVTWKTSRRAGTFRQFIEFRSDDPSHSPIRFTISGRVTGESTNGKLLPTR